MILQRCNEFIVFHGRGKTVIGSMWLFMSRTACVYYRNNAFMLGSPSPEGRGGVGYNFW